MVIYFLWFIYLDTSFDEVTVKKKVTLHRLQIEKEVIELFQDPLIQCYDLDITLIDVRGENETGEGIGVTREVFHLFFKEFLPSNTVGCREKVPFIRHDMSKNEWSAIARILIYCLKIDYFPLTLSPSFVIATLFGEEYVTNAMLLQSFKMYVSSDETKTIDDVLGEFESSEELLHLLSSYRCYKSPTKENITEILRELSHQELIQKPRYVSNCFHEIFRKAKLPPEFQDADSILSFYKKRCPSANKIIKALECEPKTEQERLLLENLKRYIKSLNENELKLFLQFITAADIMPSDKMQVLFDPAQNPCAPRAHTCVPSLELSTAYSTYNELAKDFNSVLNAKDSYLFSFI